MMMIHRVWFWPGLCAALFTIFLLLNFHHSDFEVVVQRKRPSDTPANCPPSGGISEAGQSQVEAGIPAQDRYKTSQSFPYSEPIAPEPIELDPLPSDDDGITSFPPGEILSAEVREIKTRDGSHSLRLEDNGNVVLYRYIGNHKEQNETQALWSLGTGMVEKEAYYGVRLSKEGVMSVLAFIKRADGHSDEQLLWHSDMLPGCLKADKTAAASPNQQPISLDLTSTGELSIHGRCIMFSPAPESTGRLAVLMSGMYRSNKQVCASQVKYLATPAAITVDFFAYVLYEKKDLADGVTVQDIEVGIRECYGPYLRTLTLKPVEEVSEKWPGPEIKRAGRINNIYAQLKTLYNGGQEWLDWSAANAVQHHTVFRIRTDHEFFDDPYPLLKPASQLRGNELVLQPIAGGYPVPLMSHWYCSNPYGGVEVAISDQLAYGRPTAMYFYINMFKDYARIVNMAVKEHNNAQRESWLCLAMPGGTDQKHCGGVEYGTVECALSWYLRIWDLDFTVNWNWPMRIVRVKGY